MKKQNLFSRLLKYMGKYKITLAICLIASGVSAFISLKAYVSVYNVLKEVLIASNNWSSLDVNLVKHYGWQAVAMISASFGLYGLGLACSHITAFNVVAKLRIKLIHHLGELSLGYHSSHSSGEMRKIIEKNTVGLEDFIAHQIPDTVQAIFTPLAFIGCMFYFDWKLSLICLIPIICGFLSLSFMLKGESKDFLQKYEKSSEDMSNAVVEYVRGISVVKVFGQTVNSFKRFSNAIKEYHNFLLKYALSMENTMSAYITSVHGIFFVLIPAGIILFRYSHDKEKLILSFLFFSVLTPLVAVMLMRIMISSSKSMIATNSLNVIEDILNEQPIIKGKYIESPKSYDIVFDSVSFKYEKEAKKAINNLSFTAKEGTVTALVGASGSGKSTIASLIGRFWDVDEGNIWIGGVDIRKMDYKKWMNQVSIVFQDINLFKMTIKENVAFSKKNASEDEIMEALNLAQCDDILAKLPKGIHTVIGTNGIYLSGGEMQRIALARAILKDSPVILLDEATAFADAENEYKIQKALDTLVKGKTVIMIAHRLSTITNADQILVLENGGLIEKGTHKELIDKEGNYARMFQEYQRSASWKIGGVKNA